MEDFVTVKPRFSSTSANLMMELVLFSAVLATNLQGFGQTISIGDL
jgi:hypothetical protein